MLNGFPFLEVPSRAAVIIPPNASSRSLYFSISFFNSFNEAPFTRPGSGFASMESSFIEMPQRILGEGYNSVVDINKSINGYSIHDTNSFTTEPRMATNILLLTGTYIWLIGIIIMLMYIIVSYMRIRRKVSTATLVADNIFETDEIQYPFVCDILSPKIYLPIDMDSTKREYVLQHEKIHILRKDHLIKAIAFFVLAIH